MKNNILKAWALETCDSASNLVNEFSFYIKKKKIKHYHLFKTYCIKSLNQSNLERREYKGVLNMI